MKKPIPLYLQVNALACFQLPVSRHLMAVLNDAQLTSCLCDALLRSKTRSVAVLLSSILRVLISQQQFCQNTSNQIDYLDSSEVQKFYALESIALAQLAPNILNPSKLDSLQDMDDLIHARIQKTNVKSNSHLQQNWFSFDSTSSEYFNLILRTKRNFGCTSFESCLDQSANFKRGFEQLVQESKKLEHAYDNRSHINLRQFQHEISYLSEFFCRLQNDISWNVSSVIEYRCTKNNTSCQSYNEFLLNVKELCVF